MSISLSPCCKEQTIIIEDEFYGADAGFPLTEICSFCEKRIRQFSKDEIEDSTTDDVVEDLCDFAETLTQQATERRCLHG